MNKKFSKAKMFKYLGYSTVIGALCLGAAAKIDRFGGFSGIKQNFMQKISQIYEERNKEKKQEENKTNVNGLESITNDPKDVSVSVKQNTDIEKTVEIRYPDPKLKTKSEPRVRPKNKVVVLDPGHGGKDSGTYWPLEGEIKFKESDIVLKQAYKVKKRLEDEGYEVYLTRQADEYVSLSQRKDKAEKLNANAFVSFHSDSAENSFGQLGFYRQGTGSEEESEIFARFIVQALVSNVDSKFEANNKGIKKAKYWVLNMDRPSVLIESGNLQNKNDRNILTDGVDDLEIGYARGIDAYLTKTSDK